MIDTIDPCTDFEERAAIMEHDGCMSRQQAEARARRDQREIAEWHEQRGKTLDLWEVRR